MSENARGIALMVVAMIALVCNDALMKAAVGGLPFFEALFVRGVVSSLGLWALAWAVWRPGVVVTRGEGLRLGLRGLAELGATLTFMLALVEMPLAAASAIEQAQPLAVTLGAALFLRQPVGPQRLLAIAGGFLGVLLIVRPGGEAFGLPALSALASVGFAVTRDLVTRTVGRSIPAPFIAATGAVPITLVCALPLLWGDRWIWPDLGQWGLCVGAGLCILLSYLTIAAAMRSGEIAVVAPFRYSSLVIALILGWLVFGDWPDGVTLLGAAVVIATGLFSLWREARAERLRRRLRAHAPGLRGRAH